MDYLTLITAFSLGVLGGAHCIGMCGGVMGALTMGIDASQYHKRLLIITLYNVGRILSYVLIAVIFFLLTDSVEKYFALSFMRIVAGVLLIAMGLYLAGWWKGLLYLEKLGAYVWQWIKPISRRLMPVSNPSQAILLGSIWGWLPCGLIYSALVYSATAHTIFGAAVTMLSFALGTVPAVLLGSLMAERLIQFLNRKTTKTMFALLIIVFGVWTLLHSVIGHSHADHIHSSDSHSSSHHHNHVHH